VLLRVPVEVAAARAQQRESTDTTRTRDAFERDGELQARTGAVYDGLAADQWVSPWFVHVQQAGQATMRALADRVIQAAH